jgi:orotate phosphoribosyltransferase
MNNKLKELSLERLRDAIAIWLWDNGAVKLNADNPFQLASGNHSPIYINCRQVLSDVSFMSLFSASARIILQIENVRSDVIAGGETAGIPLGAYIANDFSLPMMYVRKMKKGYGLANLVEGGDPSGKRVLLIEDLITDGGSKVSFIESIRAAGGVIEEALVLFDRQQGGENLLKGLGVRLHSILDLHSTIEVAKVHKIMSDQEFSSLNNYLSDPEIWHNERGLTYSA